MNLKLRELAQLFNSLDPSPFLDRDLDREAEEFIVSWARELPKKSAIELTIHLANPPDPAAAATVESAVQNYFANRAGTKLRDLQLLLRHGHISLIIGLVFLTGCLLASGVAARMGDGTVAEIVSEGFIIAGWVAMWRPLEIYLYDWWPVRYQWRLLQRLARMQVRVQTSASATPPPPHAVSPGDRQRTS